MTNADQKLIFDREYSRLNPAQKKAVDKLDGPIMVLAGPGTGKTQILSARIAKILLETDAKPENILCLTYTEAGVVAMRKRLTLFIGAEAYKINIGTFHSFCNEVIQDNMNLFEKNELSPISELERSDLLRKLIDNLPKGNELKRYRHDKYFEAGRLKILFETMKREGWKPDWMEERLDVFLQQIEHDPELRYKQTRKNQFNIGDKKSDYYKAVDNIAKIRAGVRLFDEFNKMMYDKHLYDFIDMINWVIKEFEENEGLLATYQEQYQYILIDEYQDTNGTQNRIAELLCSHWGQQADVFVVGDDDQSIYRFQGANIKNMDEFIDRYPNIELVMLEDNYRSLQPILDISQTLIEKNKERIIIRRNELGLTKNLNEKQQKFTGIEEPIQLKAYTEMKDELIDITTQIEALINDNIKPKNIAVIYKEHKYGEVLTKYLKHKNIAVYSKRNLNLLTQPIITQLVTIFKFLASEQDISFSSDDLLFEILHFPYFNLKPIQVAQLSVEVDELNLKKEKITLRELLFRKATEPPKDLFSPLPSKEITNASRIIEQLVADSHSCAIQQLLENIMNQTGMLQYVIKHNEKTWLLKVLTTFFDFVKEESRRNPLINVKQLSNVFQLMIDSEISLPLVQISGTDEGVNLLTAHGCKGLEFEYVFFAGCISTLWEKKRKINKGFTLPPTLQDLKPKTKAVLKIEDDEELRRLFYVCITRAEKNLTLSWFIKKPDDKDAEPSLFIQEIQDVHNLPVEKIQIPEDLQNEYSEFSLSMLKPEIDLLEYDMITRRLQNFTMNVTALNNFINCPIRFYYQNLVKVPAGKNETMTFGSAVHYALDNLFKPLMENKPFLSKGAFIESFRRFMHRNRECFTQIQFDSKMEYGEDILDNYYEQYKTSWNQVVSTEKSMQAIINEVPIKGKLDKLVFNNNLVTVIDYKTGKVENAEKKLKGPNEKDINGGDYWRQAVFYKILVDNYAVKDWKTMKVEFDFVEPYNKKEYQKRTVNIYDSDIAIVKSQITDTWHKIQNHEFAIGCGKETCSWCNFIKNNEIAIELHESVEEEDVEMLDEE